MSNGYEILVERRNDAQTWYDANAGNMANHEKAFFQTGIKHAQTPAHFRYLTILANEILKR